MTAGNKSKNFTAGDRVIVLLLLAAALFLAFKSRQRAADTALQAEPAALRSLTGYARITDGDSLEIHGRRIRLVGLDAPELGQYCSSGAQSYACGRMAAAYLRQLVAARQVRCQWLEKDKYRRLLGHCFAGDRDLNRLMVAAGWAVSYSAPGAGTITYKYEEQQARRARRGLWQGSFQKPKNWRKQHPRS